MHRFTLHPRFTSHVKPVISGAALGEIRITRQIVEGIYNYDTGQVEGEVLELLYHGNARVQPTGRPTNRDFVEDTARFQTTRVQLVASDNKIIPPIDFKGYRVNDKVTITRNESARHTEGETLFVHGFMASTNSWSTVLVCQADMKQGG